MSRGSTRSLQLDVLRGVAILLVFGRHLEIPFPNGPLGTIANAWYRFGWLGVDLFFVLSGFLIGGLLITELRKHGSINVTRFLIRRGLKLYPAYFVFIAYLLLMPTAKALFQHRDAGAVFAEMWGQLWPNLLFLQNYLGTPAGHTWSLAVEEHFYLLLPFSLAALAALGRIGLLVRLCAIAVPLFLGFRLFSVWMGSPLAEHMAATHLRLDALLFGVGIRAIAEYRPEQFAAMRPWRIALVAAGVLSWLPNYFIAPETVFIRTLGLTATLLGAGALLVAAYHTHEADFGRGKWWARQVAQPIAWIGVYSYGIYLWHVTAFGFLRLSVGRRLMSWAGEDGVSGWPAAALIMCAGAVFAGVLASVTVEWPILRVRDRLFPSRSGALPDAEPGVSQGRVATQGVPMLEYRNS